jgi:archaellum component FlaC
MLSLSHVVFIFSLISTIYGAPVDIETRLTFRETEAQHSHDEIEIFHKTEESVEKIEKKIEKVFYIFNLIFSIGAAIVVSLTTSVLSIIRCVSNVGKQFKDLKREVEMVASDQILNREQSSILSLSIVNEVESKNFIKKKSCIPIKMNFSKKHREEMKPTVNKNEDETHLKVATQSRLIDLDDNLLVNRPNCFLNDNQPALITANQVQTQPINPLCCIAASNTSGGLRQSLRLIEKNYNNKPVL